jgi:hypothetical protein
MQDPLIGTWKLSPEKSRFDANHRPKAGTMVFELSPEGHYLMKAEGVSENGQNVAERPVRFIPDGKDHPVPDFPGLIATANHTDPHTLIGEVRREDGTVVGGGTMVVSADGKSLTATNFGYDTQLRQFKQQTLWDRE